MSTDRDPDSVRSTPEAAAGVPVDPTSFAAIEAEGARERWLLARRTARSVFNDPAQVTPRCMALLGEQGLATFVDEVRSAARHLIRREREKLAAEAHPEGPAPGGATSERITEPKPKTAASRRRRRPASFQAPRPAPQPSMARRLVGRLRPNGALRRFVGDALFWSLLPTMILVGVVMAYRFAFIVLR